MDGQYTNLNKIKNVVWIIPGFAKDQQDDYCTPTLQDLVRAFRVHKNISITILALQYPYTSEPYSLYGAQVYPMNGKNKWLRKLSVWRKTMQKLNELHIQKPIDVIHSFWLGEAALIGEAFSKGKNIQHICTLMGQDVLTDNRYLKNKRLAQVPLIAISAYQAEIFKRNTGRNVEAVIPFGMLEPETYATENGWQIEDEADKLYDIVGAGTLSYVKNYPMFIEIVAEVKKSFPKVSALIIGSGPEKDELKKLVEQKDLTKTITFSGQRSRAYVYDVLGKTRIFLHTAKHEGQGYVFIEAMQKKLPIMSTPVGYACDNEKIWKGIDVQLFAEEIIHVLRNQPKQVKYQVPTAQKTALEYMGFYNK